MEAELADLKALMELKKMYSWKDDDPLFLKRQGDIMKKHAKLSKGIQKKKGGTALCVITSGGIEEWVAEDKHHFCIR